jgi:Tfp pilus assembly protein PilF
MPINDIVAEKTGSDPRVMERRMQQRQAQQTQQAARSTIEPAIQIDRTDMQVWLQLAELVLLLLILRSL